jgi:hypothetical protein
MWELMWSGAIPYVHPTGAGRTFSIWSTWMSLWKKIRLFLEEIRNLKRVSIG